MIHIRNTITGVNEVMEDRAAVDAFLAEQETPSDWHKHENGVLTPLVAVEADETQPDAESGTEVSSNDASGDEIVITMDAVNAHDEEGKANAADVITKAQAKPPTRTARAVAAVKKAVTPKAKKR